MLPLLACADPVTTSRLLSVETAVPYAPDLGSLRDPRVAGCSPSMSSHDGSWSRSWTYDEEGRRTTSHEREGDVETTTVLRWSGGCLSHHEFTEPAGDTTVTDTYDATCDDHGNVVMGTLMVNDTLWWTKTLRNTYDGDHLTSAEGELRWDNGTITSESYSYTWDGDWLSGTTEEWTYDDTLGVRITTVYTADELGQRVTRDETACAVYRDQDCVVTDTTAYTYDVDRHVLALDFRSATYTVSTDGSVGAEPAVSGAATFTAGASHVPAAGAYTSDGEATIEVAFKSGCD